MGVVGFGGLFFRAADPDGLNAWYREHLNVGGGCSGDGEKAVNEWVWTAQGGPTVFAPFDSPEVGRFARIHDPEGNPIELWEMSPG